MGYRYSRSHTDDSPYYSARRDGRMEIWANAAGDTLNVWRLLKEIYRADCKRKTSEQRLHSQGWNLVKHP